MKTFVFKIEIPDFDFTVHEDQILKDFLMEPGTFIEFMKKGISELSKSENDITSIELSKFINSFSMPIVKKHLNGVLNFSKEPGNNHEDVNEFISQVIKKL